jgi:hypothetical protein
MQNPIERAKCAEHAEIVLWVLGHEEIDVLGGADEAVGDDREAAHDDEAGALVDHRFAGDVELRVASAHQLARRLAAALPPEPRGAGRA